MSRASTNNAAGVDTVDFISLAAPHRWREVAACYGPSLWEELDQAARQRQETLYGVEGRIAWHHTATPQYWLEWCHPFHGLFTSGPSEPPPQLEPAPDLPTPRRPRNDDALEWLNYIEAFWHLRLSTRTRMRTPRQFLNALAYGPALAPPPALRLRLEALDDDPYAKKRDVRKDIRRAATETHAEKLRRQGLAKMREKAALAKYEEDQAKRRAKAAERNLAPSTPTPLPAGLGGWFAEFRARYEGFGTDEVDWYQAPKPSGLNPRLFFVGDLTLTSAPPCCGHLRGTASVLVGGEETSVRIHCACLSSAQTLPTWFKAP